MNNYPIFLLPQGELMMTAKMEDSKIKLLKKTLFETSNRFSVSENGLAASLDREKNHIIYGKMIEDGNMTDLCILPIPNFIAPNSIYVFKNHIIIGGSNFDKNVNTQESLIGYSISLKRFFIIKVPFNSNKIYIANFLFDKNKLIVLVNFNHPPLIGSAFLEYDFSNEACLNLIESPNPPTIINYSEYEKLYSAECNNQYIAFFSSNFDTLDQVFDQIRIFKKGNYNYSINFSKFRCNLFETEEGSWNNILLIPNRDFLLISCNADGIGIYLIDDSKFDLKKEEDHKAIYFINKWGGKKVIKIIIHPQLNDIVLVIFEKSKKQDETLSYRANIANSYAVESIQNLLDSYHNFYADREDNDYDSEDYSGEFENDSQSKYNGYNGYDDDTINDAFEGDPENTWNVD